MKDIRRVIKERRIEKKMSQVTLAKKANVAQSTISKLENRECDIGFNIAVKCLKALNLNINIS